MNKNTFLIGLFALLILGAGYFTDVGAVRLGHTLLGYDILPRTVFALQGVQPSPSPSIIGTTANIKYPRCMVTAAHNLVGVSAERIIAGVLMQGRNQDSEKETVLWGQRPIPESRDVGIFWVKKELGATKLREIDFSPKPLKKAGDYGLTAVPIGENSPEAPEETILIGYGYYGTNANGDDYGEGIKRSGYPNVMSYHARVAGGEFTDGTFIAEPSDEFEGFEVPGQISCGGDSGSPLLSWPSVDGIYGVLVRGRSAGGGSCNDVTSAVYVAFSTKSIFATDSTYDWVEHAIATTCTKQISAGAVNNLGRVYGTLVNVDGPLYPDEEELNHQIDCDPEGGEDDCVENVHFGESIVLTAVAYPHPDAPEEIYKFDEWQGDPCPCEGSDNPVCSVTYDNIGEYGVNSSNDYGNCEAVFVEFRIEGTPTPEPSPEPSP